MTRIILKDLDLDNLELTLERDLKTNNFVVTLWQKEIITNEEDSISYNSVPILACEEVTASAALRTMANHLGDN